MVGIRLLASSILPNNTSPSRIFDNTSNVLLKSKALPIPF